MKETGLKTAFGGKPSLETPSKVDPNSKSNPGVVDILDSLGIQNRQVCKSKLWAMFIKFKTCFIILAVLLLLHTLGIVFQKRRCKEITRVLFASTRPKRGCTYHK